MAEDQGEEPTPAGGGSPSGSGRSGAAPLDPEETYQDAFARIEAALDAGRTDLGDLGFWALVKRIKPDPALSEHWAAEAGRIDAEAFDRSVRWRFPVWVGNTVLLVGTGAGAAAVVIALRADNEVLAGLALVTAAGIWSVSVHGLAHWAVGRAAGIRFVSYFFRPGQFPPRPGIKTDYATYLRADPSRRASMHAAGAVATKLAPFVALAFYPASHAPAWAAWVVLAIGIGQIATDILFSRKSGDWSKVRRERAVAAARTRRR
ncbi:MAG: hypothetical protein ACXVQ0_01780 [Actinomycetota bacterium]